MVSQEDMPVVTCLPRPPPVSQCDRSQPGPSRSTGTVCAVAAAGAHVGYAIRYILTIYYGRILKRHWCTVI